MHMPRRFLCLFTTSCCFAGMRRHFNCFFSSSLRAVISQKADRSAVCVKRDIKIAQASEKASESSLKTLTGKRHDVSAVCWSESTTAPFKGSSITKALSVATEHATGLESNKNKASNVATGSAHKSTYMSQSFTTACFTWFDISWRN